MHRRCVKAIAVLAVLLISLISISAAAGPRAMPDIYKGQCGVELSVPAPGILANDVKSTNPLEVVDPDMISIDPKYGTLMVNADGSFVFDAAQNIPSGTYVFFYYKATDGITVTNQALVKIAVSCKCHGSAPDINVCLGNEITPEFLMSEGAGCIGCRDVTPKFDLSQIPADPVAGECYPYTVSCPGCNIVTGHICFTGPCTITWEPFTVCEDIVPTEEMILDLGNVFCSCDDSPAILDIHMVGDHWEYTITCESECGATTETGVVNIETPCTPTYEPFTICEGVELTLEMINDNADVSCGDCDATPVISDIHIVGDHWEYTITCTTPLGCTATETGIVEIEAPCEITWEPFSVCEGIAPTAEMILANAEVSCGDCDATPVISDITSVADGYDYTITCTTPDDCTATETGHVDVCAIRAVSFPVLCAELPISDEEIIERGQVECIGCSDATPVISDVHEIETDLWQYTITCNGCTAISFFATDCAGPCNCAPTAPNMCGCEDTPFPIDLFHALGGGCHAGPGCDVTEFIDDSQVDYNTPGHVYPYTVTCSGCDNSPVSATGQIYIRTLLCGPGGTNCICPTHCP